MSLVVAEHLAVMMMLLPRCPTNGPIETAAIAGSVPAVLSLDGSRILRWMEPSLVELPRPAVAT